MSVCVSLSLSMCLCVLCEEDGGGVDGLGVLEVFVGVNSYFDSNTLFQDLSVSKNDVLRFIQQS